MSGREFRCPDDETKWDEDDPSPPPPPPRDSTWNTWPAWLLLAAAAGWMATRPIFWPPVLGAPAAATRILPSTHILTISLGPKQPRHTPADVYDMASKTQGRASVFASCPSAPVGGGGTLGGVVCPIFLSLCVYLFREANRVPGSLRESEEVQWPPDVRP
ncbi:hypothetical protein LZ30DRAFT_126985 [Colletotrichum cereale]|nr:hypothetical protein LZ30DRAFT_126985 [Colletotrichum cereale]